MHFHYHISDVFVLADSYNFIVLVLRIISSLQAELFDKFLHGSTLEECYAAVAAVANRWLDLLDVCKGNIKATRVCRDYIITGLLEIAFMLS